MDLVPQIGLKSAFFPKVCSLQHRQIHINFCSLRLSLRFGSHSPYQKETKKLCQEIHNIHVLNCSAELNIHDAKTDNSSDLKTSNEKTVSKKGLIFTTGSNSAWDSGGVGSAVVRRYPGDNEERWCMWYQGWKQEADSSQNLILCNFGITSTSIGLALSSNGIHWSRGEGKLETDSQGMGETGTVLEPNSNWWTFDTHQIDVSDVLIMSSEKVRSAGGVYWMYYSGGDKEDVPIPEEFTRLVSKFGKVPDSKLVEGLRQRPGLAMSSDGMNWARIEGDHHSGALFDVGAEGDWDALFVGAPQIVFNAPGDIRMYYHSFSLTTKKFTAGFARSRDGLKWVKYGKCVFSGGACSFDEAGVARRQVLKDPSGGSGFIMVYEGIANDGTKSIGLARSSDGLWDWERVEGGPILSPSADESAWDSVSVGSPCLVEMDDGTWRLYYVGFGKNGTQGIGMAVSKYADLSSFNRWHNTISTDL